MLEPFPVLRQVDTVVFAHVSDGLGRQCLLVDGHPHLLQDLPSAQQIAVEGAIRYFGELGELRLIHGFIRHGGFLFDE